MFLPPEEVREVTQIPIFVWDKVLLPFDTTTKKIRITDPQIVQMLEDIEFGDRIFGVSSHWLTDRQTKLPYINATGCFAKLLEFDKFASGDANVKMKGLARYRVVEYLETDAPYPFAKVKFFEEESRSLRGVIEEDEELQEDLTREASLVGQRIVTKIMHALGQNKDYEFPLIKPEPLFFSFMAAPLFSFDSGGFLKLLQAMSVEIRLRFIIEWLEEFEERVDENAERHKFIAPFLDLENNKNNPNLS